MYAARYSSAGYKTLDVLIIMAFWCIFNFIGSTNSRPHHEQFHNENDEMHHLHHHHNSRSFFHQNISVRLIQNESNPRILNRVSHNSDISNEQFNPDFVPERDHNAIVFQDSSSDFVFPNSSEENSGYLRPPKCRDDQTFCETVESYPAHQLSQLLSRTSFDREFFGVDEVPPEISNRIAEPEENFFCTSMEKTIYPKVAKNKNDKWKYIINTDDKYIQGVRVEICTKPNGPCNLLGGAPSGYIIKCKQKYMFRRLISVDDSGTPLPDTFKLPSACCCSYKRDMNFLASFSRKTRKTT